MASRHTDRWRGRRSSKSRVNPNFNFILCSAIPKFYVSVFSSLPLPSSASYSRARSPHHHATQRKRTLSQSHVRALSLSLSLSKLLLLLFLGDSETLAALTRTESPRFRNSFSFDSNDSPCRRLKLTPRPPITGEFFLPFFVRLFSSIHDFIGIGFVLRLYSCFLAVFSDLIRFVLELAVSSCFVVVIYCFCKFFCDFFGVVVF